MRLSIEKRIRIVTLYEQNNLWAVHGKYKILRALAAKEDIQISRQGLHGVIEKWKQLRSVANKPSISRALAHTKVTMDELKAIERRVRINRELTALHLKQQLHLQASTRTIQKYLNVLGWRKKMTK
jgi:hypothetical protein